jgi:hypothetical protein
MTFYNNRVLENKGFPVHQDAIQMSITPGKTYLYLTAHKIVA